MAAMDLSLVAEAVTFVSPEELAVTLPNITWGDIESAAALYGGEVPLLPPGVEFEVPATVRVANASGCESSGDVTFEFIFVGAEE